jgi:hypothetical protein
MAALTPRKQTLNENKRLQGQRKTLYVNKSSIQQEDIIIINCYTSNNIQTGYMKQKLTESKRKTDSSTIIVGDLNNG